MKSVAVVGSKGFVGSSLCRSFESEGFSVTKVTRENYEDHKQGEYDVIINAAMPSRRFWSFNYPLQDVEETVNKTADLFYRWKYKKFDIYLI